MPTTVLPPAQGIANTHYVDDDLGSEGGEERGWPLEALATAPVVPLELAPVVMGRPTRLRRRSTVRDVGAARDVTG